MKNNKIKSFIYLDVYKMYSISSQIFEGLTDHIINVESISEQDVESQKGTHFSGKLLADIISKQTSSQEKKFLHDYSYTIFENHLIDNSNVIIINEENIATKIDQIKNSSFVKVSGNAHFSDIQIIKNTIKNCNEIGDALCYVTNYQIVEAQKTQLNEMINNENDRNKKAQLRDQLKNLNYKSIAKQNNLNVDDKFRENLYFLIDYFLDDMFDVEIQLRDEVNNVIYKFNSVLKREQLLEKEALIIQKHSRNSQRDFVIFGIVTQCDEMMNNNEKQTVNDASASENASLRQVTMTLIDQYTKVERYVSGRERHELIIDPIAIYLEV